MKIRPVGAELFHADANVLADAASSRFVSCVLLLVLGCVVCDCCWLAVCIVLVVLYMCCYLMCICCTFFLTLDAGLLAKSQYSEGPVTGHLDTGFSWFPYV